MKRKFFVGIFLCFEMLFSNGVLSQDFPVRDEIETRISSQEVSLDTVKIDYTWADFLQKESCQADFLILSKLHFLTQEQEKLKNAMMTYCVSSISVWDDLLTIFRQNKKNLLMDQNAKEEWFVMRHIKSLPILLLDIHNSYPTGDTLTDKLDRIQNAVMNKKPEKILLFMQDLSPNQQLFFMPLFNEVTQLIDFKNVLRKGEK